MRRWLFVLLLAPSVCWGAIAEVGSGSQRATATLCTAADSCSRAFPANVTAGSLLVVGGNLYDGTAANTSAPVTDSLSTSYTTIICTEIASATTSTPFLAYGIAPSSGANTVTVNPGGASDSIRFAIDEFSGVAASPLDVNGGSSTGTGTGTGSDDMTTGVANALIIGALGSAVADTLTPGASYTQIGEGEDTNVTFNFEFRLATTVQTYTVDWSSVNNNWSACTASFKPTGGVRPMPALMLP